MTGRLRSWRDVRAQFQADLERQARAAGADARVARVIADRERRLAEERRVTTNHSAQVPPAPSTWTEEDAAQECLDEGIRTHIQEEMAEHKRLQVLQRVEVRVPGWRVPGNLRNKWPRYDTEAVTVGTPYGQVTVGRNLARIFDMSGWPDGATLRSMVEEQSARFHGGRF